MKFDINIVFGTAFTHRGPVMASRNLLAYSWDDGLLSIQYQLITWPNAELL